MVTLERDGAVRLLQADDLGKQNAFNKPLVGWKSTSLGEGGLYNPRAFACMRVVVQKMIEGKLGDLYDQPMLVENTGSIAVCRAGDKVGLVQSFRMVGERIVLEDPNYVARLNDERRWDELFASLGMWKWELPRGIPPATDKLKDLVVAAAKLEALEEGGFNIADPKVLGRVNANPTFFAHAQYVVGARIESTGAQRPEDLEILGKTKLFGATEIRQMVDSSELDDGLTLASLAIAGFHF